jgi:LysR family nitrogen assimilation transcriptional regulator
LTRHPEVPFESLNGLPFILPSAPNGLRTVLDGVARQKRISLAPVIEADSLPLQKSLAAHDGLYTVLPLHAVWPEVAEGRLQASRILDPVIQRTVSMAFAKSKGPPRAVSLVARQIVSIVEAMAHDGMWRQEASTSSDSHEASSP